MTLRLLSKQRSVASAFRPPQRLVRFNSGLSEGAGALGSGSLPNLPWFPVRIVPERTAMVVERLGRFSSVLGPGLSFLIPGIDTIAYQHSLKEQAIHVPNQTAITKDNVAIQVDGVLFVQVQDPKKASYGAERLYYAITQLAQTTMRSELGKITLDNSFSERETLNIKIVDSINKAAEVWGIVCLRYEIRDIMPPTSVRQSMEMQAEAERRKRANILDSEGTRQAEINRADGLKEGAILSAQGEADATFMRAEAVAKSITTVADAIGSPNGQQAVSLRVAEEYIKSWGNVAKKGTTILLPSNVGDPSAMVAQALGMYDAIVNKKAVREEESDYEGSDYEDDSDEVSEEEEDHPSDRPIV